MIVDVGGIPVGVFGITLPFTTPEYVAGYSDNRPQRRPISGPVGPDSWSR